MKTFPCEIKTKNRFTFLWMYCYGTDDISPLNCSKVT